MSTVLAKKQMTEEDIKLNYITPAIMKGWKGHITMETKITDGRINIRGNIVARSKPKFVDYMLYLNDGKPIAVVEAKDNNHSVSHGLQQAMTYAQMMDLPFAYSSNGDAFYEHNFLTGQEQQITLDKFPTQDELVARYYAELNGGKGISDLEYFSSATQIGMTATPKESEKVSNIDYFGEPVYIYSLKQGIEDGFLAPFKVINITTNIGDGWRPYHGQTDIYGNVIEDRIYNNRDYDYNIILQDRINEVAREITEYLKSTDRMQKTIVFCASEDHAERMRIALINHNSDMVKESPDYCVRITGSDVYGKSKLDYFISVSEPYPVIATTSELLSTGADCKMTKLIVLDKTVESMTTFKQIIGRGTRIREKDGKTHFIVMDFRNVTRLFSDPDWDGPVEQDEGFQHGSSKPKGGGHGGGGGKEPPVDPVEPPIVDKDGCRVKIINKTVSVYDANGKLLRQEDIIDYTRTNIKGEYASLSDFIRKWKTSDKKKTIEESFMAMGIDLKALKADQGMEDVDDFDFICYVAYGKKPLTRKERANNVKKKDFFSKYSADAQAVLDILLDKYMNQGITEVEDIKVLSLADFANYGKPAKIVKLFGGKEQYVAAVRELEASIYEEVEVG